MKLAHKHLIAGWLTTGAFLFFGDSLLSKSNLASVPISLAHVRVDPRS